MPAKYALTCHIDERWVKEWGGDDSPMKFCFGSAMNGSSMVGVVAHADVVAGSITVEWVVDYYISASRKSFEAGTLITSATNFASIDFGQKYTVDRSWIDSTSSNSPKAPSNGFLFQNLNTPAAAVVAKKINGKLRPFYISPVLLPPAGKNGGDELIPTPTVAVWFQMNVDSGTMIERDTVQKFFIKMDTSTVRVKFGYDGTWSSDQEDESD